MRVETHNSPLPSEFSGYREVPEEERVPYGEFLQTNTVDVGKMIVGVKPKDLFTYQSWNNDDKIINVLHYVAEQNPLLTQITGYLHYHTKFERNVIVIGNGNHRSIYAYLTNLPINVEIKTHPSETNETQGKNPFRIINNVKKYGDQFGSL